MAGDFIYLFKEYKKQNLKVHTNSFTYDGYKNFFNTSLSTNVKKSTQDKSFTFGCWILFKIFSLLKTTINIINIKYQEENILKGRNKILFKKYTTSDLPILAKTTLKLYINTNKNVFIYTFTAFLVFLREINPTFMHIYWNF